MMPWQMRQNSCKQSLNSSQEKLEFYLQNPLIICPEVYLICQFNDTEKEIRRTPVPAWSAASNLMGYSLINYSLMESKPHLSQIEPNYRSH